MNTQWEADLVKLNVWAEEFLGGDLTHFRPATFHPTGDAVTINPENGGPFSLNDPIAGTIKNALPGEYISNGAIHRQIIGYATAKRMADNKNLFYYQMSLTLNNTLLDLTQKIGNLDFRTVKVPGSFGVFFRECENYAGIEFRVFVKKDVRE